MFWCKFMAYFQKRIKYIAENISASLGVSISQSVFATLLSLR